MKSKINKAAFEKLTPELQKEYEPKGDDYHLKVEREDGDESESEIALRTAKQHEIDARKAAEKKSKELQAQLDKQAADLARANGDTATIEAQLKATHEKELAASTAKLDAWKKRTAKSMIDGLTDTLSAELFTSPVVGKPHIAARLSVEFDAESDEPTLVILDAKGKKTDVDGLKKEILTNKDFSAIVKGTRASGGGPSPNGGPVAPVLNPQTLLNGGPIPAPPSRAETIARLDAAGD